ncbi:sarcosine oxidase subunit gamma [Breoghania corrubedonensis]|uniref:Sarcosine oxidase subunit gamma n=1 Tax=Breoghania corrubedonensis TaxID=665038 RepID=A0A2T5V7U6_9HYPH|nr:sarcosine oxidase subunit gamma family protein [Breoghania corrubedonensis]PTW59833.1 sarcosine oxidase subunit gamma [Breoghania corrubedonensis]
MADAMMTADAGERAGALSRLFQGGEASTTAGPLTLSEMPVPGQINLRGNPSDAAFAEAVAKVLGCRLPVAANTVEKGGDFSLLWLGPDEWLVLTAPGAEAELSAGLVEALAGQHFAITDVTGNRALFRLSGTPAREVLAKGCSLDLHPSRFATGQCAQTLLARSGIILSQVDDAPSYDILPRRSFAEYTWRWLEDAMAEYR